MPDVRKEHFVYAHKIKADIFYIGIGCGRNYERSRSRSNRNKFWNNVVKKYGSFSVEILHDKLTKEQACAKEVELISLYGKRFNGTGILVNLSDGGENSLYNIPRTKEHCENIAKALIGKKISDEAKVKMCNAKKGKKQNPISVIKSALSRTGIPKSQSCKDKIRFAHLGKRKGKQKPESIKARWDIINKNNPNGINAIPIVCINNGQVYKSAIFAAQQLGISDKHIGTVCRGKRNSTHGYIFKYAA